MKTKLFTLFLALVASVGTIMSQGYSSVGIDGISYDLRSNRTAQVCGSAHWSGPYYSNNRTAQVRDRAYNGDSWSDDVLVIPDYVTYEGITYKVTSIAYEAFSGNDAVRSVIIPNSVDSIWSFAFCCNKYLESVSLGDGVTWIGDNVFSDCDSLKSPVYNSHLFVRLPESYKGAYSIPEGIKTIARLAFSHCGGVTSIDIPNSVISIEERAFSDCYSLSSLIIPNGVTSIGSSAFRYCTGLTSVTIPNSVTSIGSGAFYDCTDLTTVHITDIAAWCAISFEDIVANPTYCAKNLYLNDKLITNLVIPGGVTNIGKYAFFRCDSLTSIVIQKGCQSVGEEAFYNSHYVTSITIPSTLTNIIKHPFSLGRIETVYNYAVTPQDMSSYSNAAYLRAVLPHATLYVPQQSIDAYKTAYFWKLFGNILPLQTPEPEAVENVFGDDSSNANKRKIIKDGKVYIQRGEKVYTMQGQEVR